MRGRVEQLCGVAVSPDLISKVTDATHAEMLEWQSRPSDGVYAIAHCDALRGKTRQERLLRNKAVCMGIGATCAGCREVPRFWIEQTQGAKFWRKVMHEWKTRGMQDVPVAVTGGLMGFPEVMEAVYPQALVQTCIVH